MIRFTGPDPDQEPETDTDTDVDRDTDAELVRNFFRYQDLGWGKKFFNITTGPIGKILMIQNHRGNADKDFNEVWEFIGEKNEKKSR